MKCPSVLPAILCVTFFSLNSGLAGVNYTAPGEIYFQSFDSLPSDVPVSATIQTSAANGYINGWQDDSTTVLNDHVGLPGWYLYHSTSSTEGGTNGHQRIRFGAGANTGSFWAFRNSTNTEEMALGSIGSLTVADNGLPMYRALRLTNTSGVTLTSFSLTYDGEQWRDGQSTSGETLIFDYSLSAMVTDWFSTAAFTAVPELNFASLITGGASTGGTGVNGNVAELREGISAVVSGISWAPGTDLWLRWNDPQLAGNADDGLAIDNVTFVASAEPVYPDSKLAIAKNLANEYQLEWVGDATLTFQIQHTTDLVDWVNLADPAAEVNGAMSRVLPTDLTDDTRHYFRLKRTKAP